VGDEQRLTPDEQLRYAYEQFESGRDLTLAVEEEFALLDPVTLGLVNRFEDIEAALLGTPLGEHLAGELISAEAEVRTGRCETFAGAAAAVAERRAQLLEVCDGLGIALASTGTHPWTSWKDVRLIDTPHYRRVADALQYVAWRNQTFVLHLHVGVRGADRAVRLCNALRDLLPELLALSASSPFHDEVVTGLHSTRTQLFTRAFPRCGVPDEFADWAAYERYVRFLYDTGSIEEHTQIWWSVRPHLAFPTVEIRICDGQPTLAEAQALSAFLYAVAARLLRALDEGEPVPSHPRMLLEENLWRAIRFGLSGELIELDTGRVLPARARLEQLAEWALPVAEEIGVAPYLAVPAANPAERQLARIGEGATIREAFAAEVLAHEAVRG
jgi:glutamate---cysteine ligase / carboxylate-amine ligase